MYQYRLYNYEEVEKLKRDLDVYKKAIETWNEDDFILYMETQEDVEAMKEELANYKGEMKAMEETYQKQTEHYEQKEQKMAAQIHAINHSIQQLKKDVHSIKDDVKEIRINELLEKIDQIIGNTDTELQEVKKKIQEQKKEFQQVTNKLQASPSNQQIKSRRSEYRQLQNMLNAPKAKSHLSPPPNNRMMTNPKTHQQSEGTKMIRVENGRKIFHNSKYELNKNIIIKKRTAKVAPESVTDGAKGKDASRKDGEIKVEKKDNTVTTNKEMEKNTQLPDRVQPNQQQEHDVKREATSTTPELSISQESTNTVPPSTVAQEKQTLTVTPQPDKAVETDEATEKNEENSSPNGIKKTWLLAKSLWKK
ncbi:hypothetical protein ACTNEO_08560 [Gracilibacillus sp. HCP3S3_G5_1]|uniref:hypothetical protein n=1 Tax=unclassified Gracilibacillus TaxID=2625209 RepID=UPI003F8AA6E0